MHKFIAKRHLCATMAQLISSLSLLLVLVFSLSVTPSQAQPIDSTTTNTAILLKINGPIGPATADYITRGIAQAKQQQAHVIIIQIDTPGGLDKSMRQIIKAILQSPIAVISYVAPSGARAASAGTYILYASSIAAMAPGTNIGAATPVNLGGASSSAPDPTPAANEQTPTATGDDASRKLKQDATAYIQSLAEYHQRNVDWARKAVLSGDSISAKQALELGVINLIAPDLQQLLQASNGRDVRVTNGQVTLHTQNTILQSIEPDWRTQFLQIITNPSIAYVLLLLGIYGLLFEFANPGFILPGVVGTIAILIALYGLQLLPISYVGLGLIILGIAFMVAEAFVPSFGALGIGGLIALTTGSVMLIDTSAPGFGLPWTLILSMVTITALFFFVIIGMALKSRYRPQIIGQAALIGQTARATESFSEEGWIMVDGEHWHCQSKTPILKDQKVRIIAVHGLTLVIEPLSELTSAKE